MDYEEFESNLNNRTAKFMAKYIYGRTPTKIDEKELKTEAFEYRIKLKPAAKRAKLSHEIRRNVMFFKRIGLLLERGNNTYFNKKFIPNSQKYDNNKSRKKKV